MKARIVEFGYTVFAGSPADFGTFIAAYTEKWARVIRRRQHQGRVIRSTPAKYSAKMSAHRTSRQVPSA